MCRPRSNLGTFSQPHFTSWRQMFGEYFITILLCWSSSLIRVHPDRVLHFHHLIFQDLPPLANPQRFLLHPRQPLWGGCLPPGTNSHVQYYVWFPSPTHPWFADSIVLDKEETPTLYELVLMQGSYLIMGEIPLLLSVCPLTGKQPQEQRLPDISNKPLDETNVI